MENPHLLTKIREKHDSFKTRFASNLNTSRPEWLENHKEKEINILCIAYGSGDELVPLSEMFPDAQIFGIEIDPEAERLANAKKGKYNLNLEVKTADAADEQAYTDSEGNTVDADLVLMRNPRVASGAENSNWNRIVKSASKHLTDEGIVYITVDNEFEINNIQSIMERHLNNVEVFGDRMVQKRYSSFRDAYYLVGDKKEQ